MAYFSNGTEGMQYQARWCDNCVHYEGCPVMSLHMAWNYEQSDGPVEHTKSEALECFIPMEPVKMPDGKTVDFPGKCRMFFEVKK